MTVSQSELSKLLTQPAWRD
uniref:Uncharacterized protein n=1 Tax=Anguilla anguilla TaxID=7936 RepID=A0A0E9RHP1_ANGAN